MVHVYKNGACAEDHPKAKLTMEQVIKAREQYAAKKKTIRQLADENGVFYTTMQKAINGTTWVIECKEKRCEQRTFHWPKKH